MEIQSGAIVIIMLCATWGQSYNNFIKLETIDINRSDTRIMKSFCCTRIDDYMLLCVYYILYSMMQIYNGGGAVHD